MDSSSGNEAVIKSADHYTISERESYGGNRTITSRADAKRKWWRLALTYHDNGRPLIIGVQLLAGVLMVVAAYKFRR